MKKSKVCFLAVFLFGVIGILAPDTLPSEEEDQRTVPAKQWYFGFDRELRGETILYHSPQSEADSALLVRSIDLNRYIEWETEPLPEKFPEDWINFVWMAGIDVNKDSHTFDFYINDEKILAFSNPVDHKNRFWKLKGENGVKLEFKITKIDKHDDFMGYMFLKVPKSLYPAGESLRLRVQGESAGSRSWFLIFKYRVEPKLTLYSEQAILHRAAQPHQTIRAEIVHLGDPIHATVLTGSQKIDTHLDLGLNVLRIGVPAVSQPEHLSVRVETEGRPFQKADILLKPVRRTDIYLLHHSHVDIGYTHVQEEVEEIQAENLELAVELAIQTQDYPKESRFKWNTEVMWPVERYMNKASPEKQKELTSAIQNGWIGLDALYANVLTGLCRPEELMFLLESARTASQTFGIPVDAAMITDIPGYTWGLVPVLAQSGVKYLSIGPNSGHRIGYVLSEWADRPFYWVSPSGQEKVLCWVHGKGYSWFHTGLGYSQLKKRLQETPIFEYLSELGAENYPYDIVCIRYNIGSDNGPPDPQLADTVKAWNEKYSSPRMIISSTSDMFRAFETKYGDTLPVVRGDFTGCWEDGAASSARETVLNRDAAERLIQAEILWTLRSPQSFPSDIFAEAWRNVLLYDEHTWGSWNSISDPESSFTKQQWKTKQAFALNADLLSGQLLEESCGIRDTDEKKIESIDVTNTSSWKRTDLVCIPKDWVLAGERVVENGGRPVAAQRLSSGELALLVKNVPPLGTKRLIFKDGPPHLTGEAQATENGLSNGCLTVLIDEISGAVKSLKVAGIKFDLVNRKVNGGLNDYFYVAGRNPENPLRAKSVSIVIKEKGPLVASLLIVSEAPGCRSLKREIRVIDGLNRVDIINQVDKLNVYEPEGVHFAFPFFVPQGVMRLDVAWGIVRPEYDQLPGSNKNYFSIQRWVDVSNQEYGVTWTSPDAPLVEVGEIAADPVAFGWKQTISPSQTQTFYSYIMNNYWETNYKASQEGLVSFRYSIHPHRLFNPAQAERFGIENSQPLILTPSDSRMGPQSFLRINPSGVIVTSIRPSQDGKAVLIRLFNSGGTPEKVKLCWGENRPEFVFLSSPFEERGEEINGSFPLPAYGIATLRAENFKDFF
ncbi:MAG: glycoside hydrolase family 38 C-terminal domain-containing protein [Candidatus Aminicenantes bacterium]